MDEHARAVSGLLFQLARRGGDGILTRIDETSGELAQRAGGADAELLEQQDRAALRECDDGDRVGLLEDVPVRFGAVGQSIGVSPHRDVSPVSGCLAEALPRVRGVEGAHQSPRILRIFSTRAAMSRSRPRPVGS